MIDAEKASEIDEKLAALLQLRVDQVRDYINGNVRSGAGRRTGFRFVRGTHSGSYIRDPEGTDMLPAGWEEPPY